MNRIPRKNCREFGNARSGPRNGASAIQCCYAAIGRRIFSTLTKMAESKNTIVKFSGAKKIIIDEKISLKVSRRVVNPACMAGVLTSVPNFSAL